MTQPHLRCLGDLPRLFEQRIGADSQAIVKGHLDGGDIEMLEPTIFVDEEARRRREAYRQSDTGAE